MGKFTKSIVSSECIGDSLVTINNNFANIDETLTTINKSIVAINKSLNAVIKDNENDIESADIETLLNQDDLREIEKDINVLSRNQDQFVNLRQLNEQTQTAAQASEKLENRLIKYFNDLVNIPSFYDESTFVYGKPVYDKVTGLTDKWANVFKSPNLEPVSIQFKTTNIRYKALIHAGVYVSMNDKWSSTWTRVYNNTDEEAVAYGSQEGHTVYSEGNLIPMHKVVKLKPNQTYTFNLQTYIPSWNGSVIVNGFHTPDRSPKDLVNEDFKDKIYAEFPAKNGSIGITNVNDRVKNTSFLQILLI
jgi:hypothetical protein